MWAIIFPVPRSHYLIFRYSIYNYRPRYRSSHSRDNRRINFWFFLVRHIFFSRHLRNTRYPFPEWKSGNFPDNQRDLIDLNLTEFSVEIQGFQDNEQMLVVFDKFGTFVVFRMSSRIRALMSNFFPSLPIRLVSCKPRTEIQTTWSSEGIRKSYPKLSLPLLWHIRLVLGYPNAAVIHLLPADKDQWTRSSSLGFLFIFKKRAINQLNRLKVIS